MFLPSRPEVDTSASAVASSNMVELERSSQLEMVVETQSVEEEAAATRPNGTVQPANLVRLVTMTKMVKNSVQEDLPVPFAMCLLQRNRNLPWLRLALKLSGNDSFNDNRDRVANEAANAELHMVYRDVGPFLQALATPLFTFTSVRDPVTRLLSSYLHSCRNNGEWERCLSPGKAVDFEEAVSRMEHTRPMDLFPEFRLQQDLCGLRSQPYDIVAHYEHPEHNAKAILENLGLWEEYGRTGWGGNGHGEFSDTFEGDGASDKVCQFYTPALLERVHRLYKEDFQTFGYSVSTWYLKCGNHWGLDWSGSTAKAAALDGTIFLRESARLPLPSLEGDVGAASARSPAGLLAARSGCAPTARELQALAMEVEPRLSQETVEATRFFLHEGGPFNFSAVLRCFLTTNEITEEQLEKGLDEQLYANISEHLGEISLLRALQEHPQRTKDQSEASFHILGLLPFVSYASATPGPAGSCGDLSDHQRRMAQVGEGLVDTPHYKLSGGQDFFVFSTHYRVSDIYTPLLLDVFQKSDIIVGTGDKNYNHWKPYPNIRRKIVLPYRAHYLTEAYAWNSDVTSETNVRSKSFLFRGKITRANEGANRAILVNLSKGLEALGHKDVDVRNSKFYKKQASASNELAEAYTKSNLCLVPAGDTPTSRRLFDAVAAGCLPVSLGNFEQLVDNLPFRRSIDWSRVALFGGSLQCMEQIGDEVTKWLSDLHRDHGAQVQAVAEAGRKVFRDHLSYGRNTRGLSDALLREITHELAHPTVSWL